MGNMQLANVTHELLDNVPASLCRLDRQGDCACQTACHVPPNSHKAQMPVRPERGSDENHDETGGVSVCVDGPLSSTTR